MKRLMIVTTFLLVVFVLLTCFEFHRYQELLAENNALTAFQRNNQPVVASADKKARRESSSKNGELTLKKLDELEANIQLNEDYQRVLKQTRIDLLTYEAFQNTNMGLGYSFFPIHNDKQLNIYFSAIAHRKEEVVESFNRWKKCMDLIDFSGGTDEQRRAIADYIEYRRKWSEIIYDNDVSPQEKVDFFQKMYQCYHVVERPMRDAITAYYDTMLGEFNQMYAEIHGALNSYFQKIAGAHHYGDYIIFVPENSPLPQK